MKTQLEELREKAYILDIIKTGDSKTMVYYRLFDSYATDNRVVVLNY